MSKSEGVNNESSKNTQLESFIKKIQYPLHVALSILTGIIFFIVSFVYIPKDVAPEINLLLKVVASLIIGLIGFLLSTALFKALSKETETKISTIEEKEKNKWWLHKLLEDVIENRRTEFDIVSAILFGLFLFVVGYIAIPTPNVSQFWSYLFKGIVSIITIIVGAFAGFLIGEVIHSGIIIHKRIEVLDKCRLAEIPQVVESFMRSFDDKSEKIIQKFLRGYVDFFLERIVDDTSLLLKEEAAGTIKSISIGFEEYKSTATAVINKATKSLYATCIFEPSFWFPKEDDQESDQKDNIGKIILPTFSVMRE